MNTVLQRFINKVKINNTTGCWEWIGYKVKNGYGQFSVNAKLIYAHRWIYEYMNGKILQYPKTEVCHTCDNPSCVNPTHLWLGDRSTNQIDSVLKSRQGHQKLSKQDVLDIRKSCQSTLFLARKYNVSQPNISFIKTRKNWRHI